MTASTPEQADRERGFFDGLYDRRRDQAIFVARRWYLSGYLAGRRVRHSFTEGGQDEARTR